DPAAAALPREPRACQDRVRSESALLDTGARGLAIAAVTALPLAPGTAPDALAISPDDRQSPFRHCGSWIAVVRRVLRGIGASDRGRRLCHHDRRRRPRLPQLGVLPRDARRLGVIWRRRDASGCPAK